MPSLSEMTQAGYKVKPAKSSTADQIFSILNGADEQAAKRQEKEQEDMKEQIALYNNLREQGYSVDDAHARVSRAYRSSGFIEKLVNGENSNVLDVPTQTDKTAREQGKYEADQKQAKATLGQTKANTRKAVAAAQYSDRRGKDKATGDGYSISQKRGRIADLMKVDNPFGIYSDDSESANAAKQEIGILNDEISSLSSAPNADTKVPSQAQPKAAPKYKTGQKVKYKGKVVTIKKVNPDGTYEI